MCQILDSFVAFSSITGFSVVFSSFYILQNEFHFGKIVHHYKKEIYVTTQLRHEWFLVQVNKVYFGSHECSIKLKAVIRFCVTFKPFCRLFGSLLSHFVSSKQFRKSWGNVSSKLNVRTAAKSYMHLQTVPTRQDFCQLLFADGWSTMTLIITQLWIRPFLGSAIWVLCQDL